MQLSLLLMLLNLLVDEVTSYKDRFLISCSFVHLANCENWKTFTLCELDVLDHTHQNNIETTLTNKM